MTTVQKWGNSLGVRIPKEIAESLDLRDGSAVVVEEADGAIIVRNTGRDSLEALVSRITHENRHGEIDWGEPRGAEVW